MICVDELCDLLERVRYTYSYNTDRFILYFTSNLEGWVVNCYVNNIFVRSIQEGNISRYNRTLSVRWDYALPRRR